MIPPSIALSLFRRYVRDWDRIGGFAPASVRNTERLIIAPSVIDNAERVVNWVHGSVRDFGAALDLVSDAEKRGEDPREALFLLRDLVTAFVSEIDESIFPKAS